MTMIRGMKFECTADNTGKFTEGNKYAIAVACGNKVSVVDDFGIRRKAIVTFDGNGLRINGGGRRHTKFKRACGWRIVGDKGIVIADDSGKIRVRSGRLPDELPQPKDFAIKRTELKGSDVANFAVNAMLIFCIAAICAIAMAIVL